VPQKSKIARRQKSRESRFLVRRHHQPHFVIGIVPLYVSEAVCRDVPQKEMKSGDQMLGDVGDGSRKVPTFISALADIGIRSRRVGRQRIHPLACISLHTVSEPHALEAGPSALNAREPPRCPQRLSRCVAMWCDAQRRVVERCDAPRRPALPTVMSISPTRLID
jgi:hypothetical protein